MVVAIIRVNGPTSDQQGPELNTVVLGFLYQDKGEEDDDEEQDGGVLEKAKGWVRELFHVILICDGSTPLES